jgi:hypothetical protein
MAHQLTITHKKGTYGISATCSCGTWSRYMNTTVLRGGITSKKDSIKSEFKLHKVGA